MRGNNFRYLVKQGVISIWHNRIMSFASFCILMVSLLMIGLAVLISLDIGIIIDYIGETNEIVIFMDDDYPEEDLNNFKITLENHSYVEDVQLVPKEDAWEAAREDPKYPKGAVVLFDTLGENPMPHAFRVTLNDLTRIDEAVRRFENIQGVQKVNAPFDFAEFIISIRTTFTIIGIAVLIALIVVCLVIIYNTARTSVFARRMQISIMKHVGATNAFIKFPFFIEGMFIGIIAGVVSWFLTRLAYESVVSTFSSDIMILKILGLQNLVGFDNIGWVVLAVYCAAGAALGAIGTLFSMGKHLKV